MSVESKGSVVRGVSAQTCRGILTASAKWDTRFTMEQSHSTHTRTRPCAKVNNINHLAQYCKTFQLNYRYNSKIMDNNQRAECFKNACFRISLPAALYYTVATAIISWFIENLQNDSSVIKNDGICSVVLFPMCSHWLWAASLGSECSPAVSHRNTLRQRR